MEPGAGTGASGGWAPNPAASGLDVLVVPEQVGRVPGALQLEQSLIGGTGIRLVDTVLSFTVQEVHVDTRGIPRDQLVHRANPRLVDGRLGGVLERVDDGQHERRRAM